MSDVIVVGGGVIGLSIAYELAGQGAGVQVFDQGPFGQEASWAGAGILPPGNPVGARSPEARLRAESHVLWPELTNRLREETGIDNGYINCGGLEIGLDRDSEGLGNLVEMWRDEGVAVEELTGKSVLEYESALSASTARAIRLPEKCQVRNPRHLKALIAGTSARGVELFPGCPVHGFQIERDRVESIRTTQGLFVADKFVVATGAWSQPLLSGADCGIAIEPVRGQIVQLAMQPLPFRHVLGYGPRYLVPRPDGRILIGSTEEWVGFDKHNTGGAVAGLIRFATSLVPSLSKARFERCWAGLRPGSADGLPYLGLLPGTQNLYVAAGHFRSGLQMSPATALVMRQLILEQELTIPLDGLSCDRNHESIASDSNPS